MERKIYKTVSFPLSSFELSLFKTVCEVNDAVLIGSILRYFTWNAGGGQEITKEVLKLYLESLEII